MLLYFHNCLHLILCASRRKMFLKCSSFGDLVFLSINSLLMHVQLYFHLSVYLLLHKYSRTLLFVYLKVDLFQYSVLLLLSSTSDRRCLILVFLQEWVEGPAFCGIWNHSDTNYPLVGHCRFVDWSKASMGLQHSHLSSWKKYIFFV